MSNTNILALVGRLTRDAELSYTNNGTAKAAFSIAVNRSVKKGDAWTDEASFFDLTLWGKTAEGLAKYMAKGQLVAVQGSLKQERWEKDGQKQSRVAIHVDNIELLGGKPANAPQQAKQAEDDPHPFEDDIPF